MKKLSLIIAFLVIATASFATKDKKIMYSEIVELKGHPSQEVFIAAAKWYEEKRFGNKLKIKDVALNRAVGSDTFELPYKDLNRDIAFKIELSVRDNKLKYTLSDFVMTSPAGNTKIERYALKDDVFKQDLDNSVKNYLANMKSKIKTLVSNEKW